MSPEVALVCYSLAIVLFVLAGLGVTTVRRPVALGWFGAALITLPLLVGALDAV